jgi:aspartate carbamoyltransferase catalytic subunit
MRHLLSTADLTRTDVDRIHDLARRFEREGPPRLALSGRIVVNLFYESSTRTSSSFELAARGLGADVVSVRAAGSSVDKGESLADTIRTLGAYGPDAIVIRHPQVGAAAYAARHTSAAVVNAGDGAHQHPTQSLLDLYVICEALGRLEGVRVAIVGDVLHSRVARSNITALRACGAEVRLVGPPSLMPRGIDGAGVTVSDDIDAIAWADVVYVLRMQRERMLPGEAFVPSLGEYAARWGVDERRLHPGQVVMHPGPMNRGVEIAGAVADSPASLVERQVRAGLFVRMAVLTDLLAPAPTVAGDLVGAGA